jgi:hypothetical protein
VLRGCGQGRRRRRRSRAAKGQVMGAACSWCHGEHDAYPGEARGGVVASSSSSGTRVLRRKVVDDGVVYSGSVAKRRCLGGRGHRGEVTCAWGERGET